jgi:hypothetical protein
LGADIRFSSFQYFIPPMKEGINHQIELAILRADKMGVKVLSLAALNKVSNVTRPEALMNNGSCSFNELQSSAEF